MADRTPGADPLTPAERAALIQENLRKPQVHHASCACCKPKPQ